METNTVKRSEQESNELVLEVSRFIDEKFRERDCVRHIHRVNRITAFKDTLKNKTTYCTVCGVVLEWKQSEDGTWEFWEKTN